MSNLFTVEFTKYSGMPEPKAQANQVINLPSGTKVEHFVVPKNMDFVFPADRSSGWAIGGNNHIDLVTYGNKSKMPTEFGVDQVLKLRSKNSKAIEKVAFLKEGKCVFAQNIIAEGKVTSKLAIQTALKVLRNIK